MTDDISAGEQPELSLRFAVQGGGMRLAYGLGAMEALRDSRQGAVRSFSCSSSGVVAAMTFLSPDPGRFIDHILEMFAGSDFIKPTRLHKITDVDAFVYKILEPMFDATVLDQEGAPDVWVSVVDALDATVHYKRLKASNAFELVRATAAAPVLYGRRVRLEDNREYLDGAIGDPLPLVHAISLASEHDVVMPIATKPTVMLERLDRKPFERWAIVADRRISRPVRHLLLAPNPLVENTLRLFRRDAIGNIRVLGCEPSGNGLAYSRMTRNVAELQKLRQCGYADFRAVLSRLPAHAL